MLSPKCWPRLCRPLLPGPNRSQPVRRSTCHRPKAYQCSARRTQVGHTGHIGRVHDVGDGRIHQISSGSATPSAISSLGTCLARVWIRRGGSRGSTGLPGPQRRAKYGAWSAHALTASSPVDESKQWIWPVNDRLTAFVRFSGTIKGWARRNPAVKPRPSSLLPPTLAARDWQGLNGVRRRSTANHGGPTPGLRAHAGIIRLSENPSASS